MNDLSRCFLSLSSLYMAVPHTGHRRFGFINHLLGKDPDRFVNSWQCGSNVYETLKLLSGLIELCQKSGIKLPPIRALQNTEGALSYIVR